MVVNGDDDTRVADDRGHGDGDDNADDIGKMALEALRGRTRPQRVESAGSVHPAAWSRAALSSRHWTQLEYGEAKDSLHSRANLHSHDLS